MVSLITFNDIGVGLGKAPLKKAVILLSGGLDSLTCLAKAQADGFSCYPLAFDYSQKHRAELHAAKHIAAHYAAPLKIFTVPALGQLGASALTDDQIDIPDYIGDGDIPVTYVPSRNIIFLAIAYSYAEVIGARDIFIGTSAVDYSGYPDCRPEFIKAFANMANLGTKAGVTGRPFNLHTPLIALSKVQTIALGTELGVDYSMSISCYRANNDGLACGSCDSCVLRKKGFSGAGFPDPTPYIEGVIV